MSRVFSSKAAQLWAERIAQCERSNLSAPKFCQSIGCWLTTYAPPGNAVADFFPAKTGVFIRVHK